MQSESRQAHWQNVYTKKGENEVSWFQENPAPSLELIAQIGATPASAIIDIGGGADYKLHFKNFSWRLQGDYMHGHYASANQDDYRASTGIVWRF